MLLFICLLIFLGGFNSKSYSETINSEIETMNCSLSINVAAQNVCCHGYVDGTLSDSATGCTAPYSYIWTGNGINSSTSQVSNIGAGLDNVLVIDTLGCQGKTAATTQEPQAITAATVTQDATCFGWNNGTASSTAYVGKPYYHFSWSSGILGSLGNVTNLNNGPGNLTITDQSGWTANIPLISNTPDSLKVFPTVTDVFCYGESNGAISLAISGGLPPYTITPATLSGFSAGTYGITVIDSNGCRWSDSIEIHEPDSPLTLSIQTINATCASCDDGAILGVATGGTWPYTFYGEMRGLDSGVFYNATIRVIDSRGCSQMKTKTGIVLPVELSAFKGRYMNGLAYLNWETQTETGNKGFAIQRKMEDDHAFSSIGFVKGHETSLSAKSYNFVDSFPSRYAMNYYQLKQIDYSGNTEYSNVIAIDPSHPEDASIAIVSWPDSEHLSVRSTQNEGLFIHIFDVEGRVLLFESYVSDAYITTAFWPQGTYIIGVRNNKGKHFKQTFLLRK